MKEIPLLNSSLVAIVDDQDYDRVSGKKWYLESRKGFVVTSGKTLDGMRHCPIAMHIFLFPCPAGLVRDHINHNRRDNRRENIRICTNAENCRNSLPQKGSSKFKGVCWDKERSKWGAYIKFNRKSFGLGRFHSEIDAARAYDSAARKHFGEFAYLNAV